MSAYILTMEPAAGMALLQGDRAVVLHRARPQGLAPGDVLYLLTHLSEDSDTGVVVGSCEVDAVHMGPPREIARKWAPAAGRSAREAFEELNGVGMATAIVVGTVRHLPEPVRAEQPEATLEQIGDEVVEEIEREGAKR